MKERPNYYAILTAQVRYDNRLKPNVKLLYAELTALCNMNQECFASNKYFSDLYNKSKGTISGWISDLVKYQYITVSYTYKGGTKEIDKRYITIIGGGHVDLSKPLCDKNLKSNTTSNNTTSTNINISNRRNDFVFEVLTYNYDESILNGFIDYWTEQTKSKLNPKMKFELNKTWQTELRLKTWASNQKKWDKPKSNPKSMSKLDAQINEWQKAKELL
tara:strand:+ start:673 stop:1326 length:654 start_codon:yes stop_codon:yes gene_type:complete